MGAGAELCYIRWHLGRWIPHLTLAVSPVTVFTVSTHSCFTNYEAQREHTIYLDICSLQPLTQIARKSCMVFQDGWRMCSIPGSLQFVLNGPEQWDCRRRKGFCLENQTLEKTKSFHHHASKHHSAYDLFYRKQNKREGWSEAFCLASITSTDHWVCTSMLLTSPSLKTNTILISMQLQTEMFI